MISSTSQFTLGLAKNFNRLAPTCSVVVCTRDRPTQLDQCLAAIARLSYPQFEVLVVDNAPSDERAREVAARWGVRYLVEPVAGLSRARNLGARACHTPIVAFLDDDAIPEPDWLANVACEFDDPLVIAVTGRILPFNPETETETERLLALLGGSDIGSQGRRVDRQTPAWFEIACFGGIGSGGNMAFRSQAFDMWPGFDERLGRGVSLHGGEEHYAFFSLIDRGYRVVYTPHAIVRHPCPQTLQELRARHLHDLAALTGYLTFLFVEEPSYRRAILRYAAQGLIGTQRTWRTQVAKPRPSTPIAPWWRRLLALLSGPFLYFRVHFTRALPVSTMKVWRKQIARIWRMVRV